MMMMITLCNDSHDDNSHESNGIPFAMLSGKNLQAKGDDWEPRVDRVSEAHLLSSRAH